MSVSRNDIIQAIRNLKAEGKPGWNGVARPLFKMLEQMDDPFRDLVHSGTDETGRHSRSPKVPLDCHYIEPDPQI